MSTKVSILILLTILVIVLEVKFLWTYKVAFSVDVLWCEMTELCMADIIWKCNAGPDVAKHGVQYTMSSSNL